MTAAMQTKMKTFASLALLGLLAAAAAACVSQPRAKVVGVSGTRSKGATTNISVVVEVINDTDTTLLLSGLDYTFQARKWFTASGSYAFSRVVPAGERALVEIPVPVKHLDLALGAPNAVLNGVKFRLEGELRALEGHKQVAWHIEHEGAVGPIIEVDPVRRRPHQIHVTVREHSRKPR